ncbi:hypothetical protein FACS189426_14380 [Bacteroidia bacterium]|nr:hypothetical protein FACS189426_14380 [Bacteroidia bacterium]GHV70491.1 hypothetical protein FACS189420_1790 [Bacteroidia bacterium]
MTLYEDCLNALDEYKELSQQESARIVNDVIEEKIKFTWYGRIDWDIIKNKQVIESFEQLKGLSDRDVYLFWDDAEYPVLITKLKHIVNHWDDVWCLGFRTWIVSIEMDFFLEFYDELLLGFAK